MYIKQTGSVIFIPFCVIFTVAQVLLLSDGRHEDATSSIISILLSAAMCLCVFFYPLKTFDLLSPPKILSLLLFTFFPLFSLFYLSFPELGKWYVSYFSEAEFSYKVALATCCTVAALPFFLCGYLLGERWRDTSEYTDMANYRSTKLVRTLIIACIGLGLLGMLSYANSIGGIRSVMEQMESIANRKAWRETSSQAYYIGMLLMTAPTVLALQAIYEKAGARKIIFYCVLMVISSSLLMVTQASREKAIVPFILFTFCIFLGAKSRFSQKGKRLAKLGGLVAVAILLATFSIQTIYRASNGEVPVSIIHGLRDFNRIDVSIVMFSDFFAHNSGNGYLLGVPLFDYPNQFLVRFFDAEPIKNTSEILNEFIFAANPDAGNPGSPFVGEVYLNFGFIGYLLFIPIGFFFARLHKKLMSSNCGIWETIFYSTWLYFFIFKMCIYTGLSESILMIALVFLPLYLWKFLLSLRIVIYRKN